MPLPDLQSLKTQIVMLFRQKPLWTATNIQNHLAKHKKIYSLQAVYKELRHLMAEGIVKKVGLSYSINGTWALQLQAFANNLSSLCFQNDKAIPDLEAGESFSWTFHRLIDLNDFWSHMALYLRKKTENDSIYAWNPHLWIWLLSPEKEERFYKSLSLIGGKFYVVIGNAPLNLQMEKYYKRNNNIYYTFDDSLFKKKMNTYLNAIGDYIITVRFSKAAFLTIDRIFSTNKDLNKIENDKIINMFTQNETCTISLEHNAKKAEKLRSKIQLQMQ